MKNKKIVIWILVVGVLLLMIFSNEKEKEIILNYTTTTIEEGTIYNIEDNKYIQTEDSNTFLINVIDKGIMIGELYPDIAPITVKNFKKLVSEKFYNNLIFHRVISNFMIQTGDPLANGTGGSDETITGEFSENGIKNDLSHTRGIISMARRGSNPETSETMNSASSQFFIVHQDSVSLDGKYAAFGKIINGIDVVDNIASLSTYSNDMPIEKVIIKEIIFVNKIEGE